MAVEIESKYVDYREGGYYVADTRIGLDIIVRDFRNGDPPETILQSYPSIRSLAKVYGVITFILEHPEEIEQYLQEQEELWEEIKRKYPIPPEMIERTRKAKEELSKNRHEASVSSRCGFAPWHWLRASASRSCH